MNIFDSLIAHPSPCKLSDHINSAVEASLISQKLVGIIHLKLNTHYGGYEFISQSLKERLYSVIATRLEQCLKDEIIIGKMYSDEILIIYTTIRNKEIIEESAKAISSQLAIPIELSDETVESSSNMGICLCPEGGTEVFSLLRNAGAALLHSQQQGENSISIYRGASPVPLL